MTSLDAVPVVARIHRGAFIESVHRGIVVVARSDGRLLFRQGAAETVIALRSSAKPFQLVPLVESGAADHFGFTPQELAVMAGSHSGRAEHVQLVRSILAKARLDEGLLRCGAHIPFDAEAAEGLIRSGSPPSPLHNNCSGKHAAMLALAAHLGEPLDSYLNPGHAVQLANRSVIAWAGGVDEQAVGLATDGCSAPTFFVSAGAAAAAFARLASSGGEDPRSAAMARIRSAMMAHPELVAGPGRFDTAVMAAYPGLCAKGGAEGVQGMAARLEDGRAMGIVVKISDGSGRAAGPVALEALGVVADGLPGSLEALRAPPVKNHRGAEVGRIEPVVDLKPAP